MPKTPAFTPKQPIEKLPLAVRKDVRDNYEAQKEESEKTISDLLGTPFKLVLNPNEIWAYNDDTSSFRAGSVMTGYVDGFISCLKRFIEKYEDEGKTHFNSAVTESELKVGVNPLGDKAPTIDCAVKDGVFWILFHHTSLGYNQDYIYDNIVAAIEAAPREGMSLRAKHSIAEDWEEKIDDLKEELIGTTGISDLILDPNFEENYKVLKADKSDDGWEEKFGMATFEYFEYFRDNLVRQGFKGDDMLQEGLADALTSKKFILRVVPKITASYNEVVLDDGAACMQTTSDNWWVNVSQVGEGFINLL
ncbi:hypothetical protein E1B28_009766 [Marasmius oreades]|uniref:Uncharacterized protein n=1 Tax=Marasmius oreades TaxID=181124 RepID=A0A9P7RWE8_9AGAR|nr:uncharacterized protein E1B28_009766 [Marasmius oreades]KAG7090667.1 hypothetical protein E1B28_009766 [Marasmius oreades]